MLTEHTDLIRKLPSPLFKLGAQAYIDKEFPRHTFIETTAACNLSCAYCPREKNTSHMEWGLFTSIIDEATQYGPRSFSLHLFGEPLMYPKILEAIEYIKTRNRRHTILLTTNGTYLNRFSRQLMDLGVDRIIWSYRKNNFDDQTISVLRRIGLIRLLIEETPKEEFEKWSKFPRVEIKHLHNYGGHIDVSKWGLKTKQDFRYPCYHLWLAPAIRWNGDITICCNDPTGRETIYNYSDHSLYDFWHSEPLSRIRESHINGQYNGLCVNCDSWKAYPDIFFGWQKKCSHAEQKVSG